MTRQKSDDRIRPEGRRKAAPTRASGGGKAITVDKEQAQPELPFATAEHRRPERRLAMSRSEDVSTESSITRPKAKDTTTKAPDATMERVANGLTRAFEVVAANRGAPGPDGMTIGEARKRLPRLIARTSAALLDGSYRVGAIRRVMIPKSGGGERGLGIPNVVDRMVQQAVRAAIEPVYEPTFHPSSHGFRPNRGCHTAIKAAREHVSEGYEWVVDIDLEKFFDRVHHQRLMARLAERVRDRRVLDLIAQMLRAEVVMPDGVRTSSEEGVPQGGPLSPLLSNVVLDELDQELGRRGHRFVRYADDCNIYVRSLAAGKRVMASVSGFIQRKLRLKVNESKSAVARPETRHFLGYRLWHQLLQGTVDVLLSERSEKKLRERIRELTPRNWGRRLEDCIRGINTSLDGWMSHFRVCTEGAKQTLERIDAHIRRRLRAIVLRQWKRKPTIAANLVRHGVQQKTAWRRVYAGRKSTWPLSHDPAVERGLRNVYFTERGLKTLTGRFSALWTTIAAPTQLTLGLDSRGEQPRPGS